eukprot:jgi/Tetstr1/443345/TSEL_031360.t1
MSDGEEPIVESTLELLQADVKAQSATLLRELATTVAQLTARDRVVGGGGAHGSVSGRRIAGQPTGSGGGAVAGVDMDVVAGVGVAAKVSTSAGVGRLSSVPLALCETTFR